MKNRLLFALASLLTGLSYAAFGQQDGILVPSFGVNGIKTITSLSGSNLTSCVLQSDGKLLIGGVENILSPTFKSTFYINRLLPNGSTDNTFNNGINPLASLDSSSSQGAKLALRPDGTILYGGGRRQGTRATFGTLSSAGAILISPVGPFFASPSYATFGHTINALSYNATSNTVAIGGNIVSMLSYMIAYKFAANGDRVTNFGGTGSLVITANNPAYLSAKAVLNLDDGSILLGGESNFPSPFTVVKLRPDGSFDPSFGTELPVNGASLISFGGACQTGVMKIDQNGKILVGGTSNEDFTIFRLNANGTRDLSFNAPVIPITMSTELFKTIEIQADGKILAAGVSSANVINSYVVRFNPNGELDSTFGINGKLLFSNFELNASAISLAEKAVYVVGRKAPNGEMAVMKISYETQKINILGKDVVSIQDEHTFTIHPYDTSNYFFGNWLYSGNNVLPISNNVNQEDEITYYFNSSSTPGTLRRDVLDKSTGAFVTSILKLITINYQPSSSKLLTEVQCQNAQTIPRAVFLNDFSIRQTKISSTNTGASPTGYNDLTASGTTDTIFSGNNYQARLSCIRTNSNTIYAGFWMDINNNGKMDEQGEFLGSSVSNENNFNINNLLVPVEAEIGVKRIRVRVRQSGPFSAIDYCIENLGDGETEDYLAVVGKYDRILSSNFITPNNDGKNDSFVIQGIKTSESNSLKVFNRSGDMVFESVQYDNTWGGIDKNGGNLQPGTYYFIFNQTNKEKANDDLIKGFFEIRY